MVEPLIDFVQTYQFSLNWCTREMVKLRSEARYSLILVPG